MGFASLNKYLRFKDKDAFIKELAEDIYNSDGEGADGNSYLEIELKKSKLEIKRERYQEMYANSVMTLTELKEKISSLDKELQNCDRTLGGCMDKAAIKSDRELEMKHIIEAIESFLKLEGATNIHLRRIIDTITVNKNGEVKVYIKTLKSAPNNTHFGV